MIKFKNLSLGYHNKILVKDINLEIAQHSCTGIFGANGTGKSTLFLTMLGLIPALAGEIRIDGKDPKQARAICSLMPQQDPSEAIFHHKLKASEILKFSNVNKNSWGLPFTNQNTKNEIIALLKKMHSEYLLQEIYSNLSGGQRQIIRLAQALLPHPKVLLLDEPLTGLDKKAATNFVSLIAEIKTEFTILIISHEIEPLKPILDNGMLFFNTTYIAGNLTMIEKEIDPHDECNR